MSTFLLIHGAWHGGWCWEFVAPLLEAAGHRVVAPDLPGMGGDKTPLGEITLERWGRFVAGVVREQGEPVVLVGHSRGGVVISQAAEYAPECLAGLVYLAAFLVPNGRTLQETMQMIPPRPESDGSLVMAPDGTATIAPDAVKRVFYNTTPDDLVARAAALSGPEPMVSFATPLQVTDARWGRVPRSYIMCTEDRAIAPRLQHLMVEALPCREVLTMATDHSPFYSAPDALARCLIALAGCRDRIALPDRPPRPSDSKRRTRGMHGTRAGGIIIYPDVSALLRFGPGDITNLTEAATNATFYRDDLTADEIAANRRVVAISTACCTAAAGNEHQHLAAAFAGDRLVGYMIATRHGPDDLELDWLMVHPDQHGSGVAARLMQAGIDWLGADRPIWLNVIRHNERAIRFYRRFGFEIDRDAATSHVVPHWIMRRPAGANTE